MPRYTNYQSMLALHILSPLAFGEYCERYLQLKTLFLANFKFSLRVSLSQDGIEVPDCYCYAKRPVILTVGLCSMGSTRIHTLVKV